ncbi:microspherule protein 1 [Aspergillus niger]|uniref:Uncharacterized protein n=1 Tax=Aspergillus welwitschiae TaxID=1341132 RepID=A0A3F3QGA5_9EURO|nr:hypothetical protein BDQ94DRAFT_166392 [Aspergillus welwitschiae]KAI2882830.1 hypothetical protein CBS11852_9499 [Aspergillus niger]KAI2984406.1 hypothetical protein CBS147344_7048 [Aspergillus niger]RDH38191.1 hypothetical protein BDQ94DRAFT_166392 [Aspergillus welwitschiae]GKZ74768.1 microspherule protein 1 [Aspergillus niger]GLA20310.1 microspherule protein 1 [Aspergillus niger]
MSSSTEGDRLICPECRGYCDVSDNCPTCTAAEPAMLKAEISDSQDDTALKMAPSAEDSPQQDNSDASSATAKAPSAPQSPSAPQTPQAPPPPPAAPKKTSKTVKKSKKMESSSSSSNSPQKEKLTPACASCKKAKRRCVHRSVIPDAEGQGTSQPPKKRKQTAESGANPKRARKDCGDASGDNDTGSEGGQPIKLKFKNVEFETAKTGESSTPKKRGRPSKTLPGNAEVGTLPSMEEEEEEEEEVPRKRAKDKNYGFPKDSLLAASRVTAFKHLDKQLQDKILDCEDKWKAAKDTIEEIRYILNKWMELWEHGKV